MSQSMSVEFGLGEILNRMPQMQVDNLRRLTSDRLNAADDDIKAQYIKVVFVDNLNPRAALWEIHVPVTGLDPDSSSDQSPDISTLQRKVQEGLPRNLRGISTKLYFASAELARPRLGQEHLRQFLALYCDKLYDVVAPDSVPVNEDWQAFLTYFAEARQAVQRDPNQYLLLCRSLRDLFRGQDRQDGDQLYRHLVLLRSLPECLALGNKQQTQNDVVGAGITHTAAAADSVVELLSLLEWFQLKGIEKDNEATIYSVINALEWLVYLVPALYNVEPAPGSTRLYNRLVERLIAYIKSDSYTLAIRTEAAWALGWASVSSIAVASRVHEALTESSIRKLGSSTLRKVAAGAYLRASFTLASFGPARVTVGAERLLAGSFLDDRSNEQNSVTTEDALSSAAKVVFSELDRIVGERNRKGLAAESIAILVALVALVCIISNIVLAHLLAPTISPARILALNLLPILGLAALTIWFVTRRGRLSIAQRVVGWIVAGLGLIGTIYGLWPLLDPVAQQFWNWIGK
jgi:hypothetical protein